MKRKVQSACVEDADPQTEEPIFGTQSSASTSPSAQESHLRRKTWRKSGQQHIYECRDSEDLGSVLDLISQTDQDVLTILAGAHDDNAEIWAECESSARKSGKKHRFFYLQDDIINGESKTYIARTIAISATQDLSAANPSLIIAQRRISAAPAPAPKARQAAPASGAVSLRAHRLSFGARIDLDRPYIFARLGDEMAGVGCVDLHVTFRSVRDWESVLKKGSFGGWDRDVVVGVSRAEIAGRVRVVYDLDRDCRVGEGEGRPTCGVAVEAAELEGLLGEEGVDGSRGDVRTPVGKRRRVEGEGDGGGEGRSFVVKLIGQGPEIDGHPFKADINVRFVLKP